MFLPQATKNPLYDTVCLRISDPFYSILFHSILLHKMGHHFLDRRYCGKYDNFTHYKGHPEIVETFNIVITE